jgi:hypothetical protein
MEPDALIEKMKDLSFEDLSRLAAEVDEEVAARTDEKFAAEVKGGAFHQLAREALEEEARGETRPLDEILDDEEVS